MHEYTITLANGDELRVTTEPSLQGRRAYSLLFDANANVLAETDSTQYIDYCETCILIGESSRVGIPDMLAWYSLETLGHVCTCD